ncbi:uncharacterized protein LOC119677145 [Teleopsis dalmanni]|uniref:uncharacterized protein LOC119677145 n=1 Tax=Teleopsis dalmanni TaxID=139649 RepID=UPI0018CF896A|nr:uncharacterized protein LOC119677145 [Teleopsis dalmanni]
MCSIIKRTHTELSTELDSERRKSRPTDGLKQLRKLPATVTETIEIPPKKRKRVDLSPKGSEQERNTPTAMKTKADTVSLQMPSDKWTKVEKKEKSSKVKNKIRSIRPKADAILIEKKVDGTTYADILKKVKDSGELKALSENVRTMRPTQNGGLLIELKRSKDGGSSDYHSAIEKALESIATVNLKTHTVTIQCRDLITNLNTDEELLDAIGEQAQVKKPRNARQRVYISKMEGLYQVSCCAPPRWSLEDFERLMVAMELELRGKRLILITGDFNAWSTTWGSTYTNPRGRLLEETFSAMDLVLLNTPGVYTFDCVRGKSIIDLAFADRVTANNTKWKVEESIYTHSDHRAIMLEVRSTVNQQVDKSVRQKKWNPSAFNSEAFSIVWEDAQVSKTTAENMAEQIAIQMETACDISMPRCKYSGKRQPLYWWSSEIADIRRACIKARRKAQRARRHISFNELYAEYRIRKHDLKKAIEKSKNRCFKQMRDSADEDPWGLAYKIVMQKVKGPRSPQPTCPILLKEVVLALFPPQEKMTDQVFQVNWNTNIPPVTSEEVMQTLGRILGRMLDTIGKVFERIISERLQQYLEGPNGLSDKQNGFRRARSTVDAIRTVTNIAKEATSGGYTAMKYCAVITLDIKNAFNSANWSEILLALKTLKVLDYLVRIICSYFNDRILQYDTEKGRKQYEVTGRVPQGSVLGPTLWNAMYDGILKIRLPDKVTIVGYADDIALVVVDKKLDHLEAKCNDAAARVQRWLKNAGLELAVQKIEAVLITARKQKKKMKIIIGGHEILSQEAIKYLGVIIDARLSFKQHLTAVSSKAAAVNSALTRILPNTGGPQGERRRLLSTVTDSIIFYAAPIWAAAKKHQLQQSLMMQSASLLEKYQLTYVHAKELSRLYGGQGITPTIDQKSAERAYSFREWQQRWEQSSKGRWTYTLIPNIKEWVLRKHGEIEYNLTQILSGHGGFLEYLHRFHLSDSPYCPNCHNVVESAEHVAFSCERFNEEREILVEALGYLPSPNSIVHEMCSSSFKWKAVKTSATQIMRRLRLQEEERRTAAVHVSLQR